jgi:hypothetical protein
MSIIPFLVGNPYEWRLQSHKKMRLGMISCEHLDKVRMRVMGSRIDTKFVSR